LAEFGHLKYIVTSSGLVNHEIKLPSGSIVTNDLEEVLKDSAIKSVVIVTPTLTHFHLAKKCIDAGKNVLVEKPAATTALEFRSLLSLANINNVTLMVAYVFQHTKCQQWVSEYIKNGGQLLSCRMEWRKYGSFEEPIWYTLLPHQLYAMFSLSPGAVISRQIVHEHCINNGGRLDALEITYQFDTGFFANILLDRSYRGAAVKKTTYSFQNGVELVWEGLRLKQSGNIESEKILIQDDEEPLKRLITDYIAKTKKSGDRRLEEYDYITEKCIAEIEWIKKIMQ
jgi:predicted dehydrogenase